MATPPSPTHAYASVYTLCQTLDLDSFLDPVTGYCPRLRAICKKLSEDEELSQAERELALAEGDTWGLIQGIMGQRKFAESRPQSSYTKPVSTGGWRSQKSTAHALIQASDVLTELVIVREWAMDAYRESTRVPVEAASTMGYWRFTTSSLNQDIRMGQHQEQQRFLDPDAPSHSATRLSADDTANDGLLCHILYQLIRSGRLDEAYEVCWNSHQPWRAASLRGSVMFSWGALARDIEERDEEDEDEEGYEGNLTRRLWKKTCNRVALNPALPDYERLLYASLVPTSSVSTILKQGIETYQDALWVVSSTLVEERVEDLLGRAQAHSGYSGVWGDDDDDQIGANELGSEPSVNAQDGEAEEADWEDDVHSSLEGLQGSGLVKGYPPTHPLNQTQLYLILNQLNALYDAVTALLEENVIETNLLRFFAHFTLFLRFIGMDTELDPTLISLVLDKWVGVLEASPSSQTYTTLIPLYTHALGGDHAVERYSSWLVTWARGRDIKEREDALIRAKENGLDSVRVAVRTAEKSVERGLSHIYLWSSDPLPNLLEKEKDATDDEEELIRSLEWTILLRVTHPIALEQCTVITRHFLACGKLGLAKRVMRMVGEIGAMETGGTNNEYGFMTTVTTQAEYSDYLRFMDIWQLFDAADEERAAVDAASVHLLTASAPTLPSASSTKRNQHLANLVTLLNELNGKITHLMTREWITPDLNSKVDEASQELLARIRAVWIPELAIRFAGVCIVIAGYGLPNGIDEVLQMALELVNVIADNRYHLFADFLNSGRLKDFLGLVQSVIRKSIESGGGAKGDPFRLVQLKGVM